MSHKTALISIRPQYVRQILQGSKRLEFRRSWAVRPVNRVLIYSTNPQKRLVAVATLKRIIVGSPTALWALARQIGGGVTRQQLFDYLRGKQIAVALELSEVQTLADGIAPAKVFGRGFRAPQSFRYLRDREEIILNQLVGR